MVVLKILLMLPLIIEVVVQCEGESDELEFVMGVLGYSVGGRYLYRLSMGDIKGHASYSEHHLWPSCGLKSTIGFAWNAPIGESVRGVEMEVLTGTEDLRANSTTGVGGNTFRARVFIPEYSRATLVSIFVFTYPEEKYTDFTTITVQNTRFPTAVLIPKAASDNFTPEKPATTSYIMNEETIK